MVIKKGINFSDLSIDGVKLTFDLNIMGTVIPCMIFGKVMIQQDEGVIINTSSMSADTPLSRVFAYSAAKAGVSSFTKWLAADMAMNHSPKIRVNEIRPGFFPTLQNADLITIGIDNPNFLSSYVLVDSCSIFRGFLCASRNSYAYTSPIVETVLGYAACPYRRLSLKPDY